jgi:single-strand DNA-binding protein
MANLNKVLLLGHLTWEPDLRYTPNGTAVTTFGLAINHRYRQGEEWKDEVCFVDVATFGRQAETAGEYLHKGSPALVEGRLRWHAWETDDG